MAALPPGSEGVEFWSRSAGLGSLGRPRFVARAMWCGDYVVREAKAVVRSAWTRAQRNGGRAIRCMEIAGGRYRAPDPWYRVADGIAVRRLSPNNRKISARGKEEPPEAGSAERQVSTDVLSGERMLRAMGNELAAVHLGCGDVGAAVRNDFTARRREQPEWLAQAAETAAKKVRRDHKLFRKHRGKD